MGNWVSAMERIAGLIVPPPIGASPELHRRWQWSVSAMTMLNGTAIFLMVGLSFGYFSSVGISGFARADDIKSINATLAKSHRSDLDRSIWDIRVKQCAVKDDDVRQTYTRRLTDLLSDWQDDIKQPYRLPPCGEL